MGWQEIAFIVVLVIVFVRPRDIPALLHKLGYVVGQAKSYMNEITQEIERTQHNIDVLDREKKDQSSNPTSSL